ncbi:MAG: GNAT family N-acetyltransferase [Acidobacteria bacterium]|nr:MAG: GNAT family N-acetyltransferase [Acidobacteriota bacterium]
MDVKTLSTGDETVLRDFLSPRVESSMFLLANAHAAGLVDRGEALQGTYVAAREEGRIVGVAAHFWNGMLVLQASDEAILETVARAALSRSRRDLRGLAGPRSQIDRALGRLDLRSRPTSCDTREMLYSLDLRELRVPEGLASGRLVCRPPFDGELELLARWRADFSIESLGLSKTPELESISRGEVERLHREKNQWVLIDGERLVSYSGLNARLPDVVQVGGVWTPPDLRGRGYGRCAVAGSLLAVEREGVARAVLFTDEENHTARAAYEALGFQVVGDYGLVIFSD